MRTLSIKSLVLDYIRAIPEVFMDFDLASIDLVDCDEYFEIVSIIDDQDEVILGEAWFSGLDLIVDIFD